MSSTRLPGKILNKVQGKTLLEYMLERIFQIKNADQVVIATTTNSNDDILQDFCESKKITCFRGSENDVLLRYFEAALKYNAGAVVRLTSDCPLIDPDITGRVISIFKDSKGEFDYVSNVLERTFPRGLDSEVFSFAALERAHSMAKDEPDREHVTRFIYTHPEIFKLAGIRQDANLSRHRWTVDTLEDLELVSRILETLYPINQEFRQKDVLDVLARNTHWEKINAHIEQKKT
jgi:spore coat polysaccharide biosynthesis protein SpsF